MEIFWKTIGLYNTATWQIQTLLIIAGIALSAFTIAKPCKTATVMMKTYFVILYSWIAAAYYWHYCDERNYNEVMAIIWAVMAAIWAWDLIAGYMPLERSRKYDTLACVLMALPFAYPLFSLARGLSFPEMTSPVMPCSVVTFTIGYLLIFSRKVNMVLVLFLCHWSLIGISKTYFYSIPEDFLLASASVPALYLFFKEYYISNSQKTTKPSMKYINGLLITLCVALGTLLTCTLVFEFYK